MNISHIAVLAERWYLSISLKRDGNRSIVSSRRLSPTPSVSAILKFIHPFAEKPGHYFNYHINKVYISVTRVLYFKQVL